VALNFDVGNKPFFSKMAIKQITFKGHPAMGGLSFCITFAQQAKPSISGF